MGVVVVMCILGLVVLYSAADQSPDIVLKQSIHMLIGLIAMVLIAQVTPQQLERLAPVLYLIGIALLLLVLVFGTGRGAQRWLDLGLFRFQPSELMKLAVPLTVAGFVADKVLPPHVRTMGIALAILAVPVIFIAEQPDLGTAILVAISGLFVLFFARRELAIHA